MGKRLELARLLVGADPKLRRMMQYWAATAVLYTAFLGLLYDARMGVPRGAVHGMALYTVSGIAAFYLMVRASPLLGLAPTTLAVLQGVFGVSCNMWAYSIAGPLRGATLMGLIVVVVFCTFALRPRQTLLLAFAGLLGMGGTMWWNHLREPLRYPAAVEVGTFAIMAACSLAVTFLTGEMTKLRARLKTKKMALEAAVETIRTLATIDELTALANRRHMNEVLALEQRRTPKHGPTCVALLDIDFFKQINDRHGHAAGDAVLRAFAQAARAELRDGDVLARWGGEEFLLMLPDTQPGDARAVLGRVRARVAALALPGLHLERPVSFSAGLSALHGDETFADTISRADKALYQAKAAGRDRVVETY